MERESIKEHRAARSGPFNPDAFRRFAGNMRERVASQVDGVKLPTLPSQLQLPQLPPGRAADWIAERRRAAADRAARKQEAAAS